MDAQQTPRRAIDKPIDSIHRALSGLEDSEIPMWHTAKVGRQQLATINK
jgi:hypothetical protein